MDQFGTRMDKKFNINAYTRKKELFYCTLEFSRTLDESLISRFLALMSEYYSNYYVSTDYQGHKVAWESFLINFTFEFDKGKGYYLHISPIVYIQRKDEMLFTSANDGIVLSFSWDSKKECFNLLLDFYADVVTDKIYFFENGKYYEEDQSIAASKNRRILTNFLKAVEVFLEGEIVECITDNYLTKDSVYKYGVTEDARHITDRMFLD